MSQDLTVNHLFSGKIETLFETDNATLYQCDSHNNYLLQIHEEEISFKACELISFARKFIRIDLEQLLSRETPDLEIINMPHCDRLFIFTINDILEIRELLSGAFAMLELNSIIHKEIVRKGVLL